MMTSRKNFFLPPIQLNFLSNWNLAPKKRIKEKKKLNYIVYKILRLKKSKDWYELHDAHNNQTNEHAFVINDFIYSIVDSLCDWKKE